MILAKYLNKDFKVSYIYPALLINNAELANINKIKNLSKKENEFFAYIPNLLVDFIKYDETYYRIKIENKECWIEEIKKDIVKEIKNNNLNLIEYEEFYF